MDMKCTNCGEPWDWYYLQHELSDDEAKEFSFGETRMHIKSCPCCLGLEQEPNPKLAAYREGIQALSDVLGDDIDGIISGAQDFEQMLEDEF